MPLSNPIFRKISRIAGEQGVRAFVVGGYVRDHYLRRPSTDIDVVVVGSGIALAEALGRELHTKVSVFKTFGTAMLRAGGIEVEFVGARKESYTHDSRKPQVEAGTLEDDQRRRDFTINAMAWSLDADSFGELVDPFDGMYDLEECIIRTPCDPDITFSDDPLRMMRAVRFASQLGFTIEEETFDAIRRNAPRIGIVSRERIAAELNKIVLSPVPSIGFELLEATGLLERIFPELHNLKGVEKRGAHAHKDNFVHTLKVLDNVARHSDDLWLRWAAVLHDIAKPLTKAYDPKAGWTFHGHEVVVSLADASPASPIKQHTALCLAPPCGQTEQRAAAIKRRERLPFDHFDRPGEGILTYRLLNLGHSITHSVGFFKRTIFNKPLNFEKNVKKVSVW